MEMDAQRRKRIDADSLFDILLFIISAGLTLTADLGFSFTKESRGFWRLCGVDTQKGIPPISASLFFEPLTLKTFLLLIACQDLDCSLLIPPPPKETMLRRHRLLW